jgi:tetratricopeptide (TPR) repeat protein
MRDLNTLDEVSQVLMNLPVDAVRQIGFYYHALAINRKGQRDEAEALFEKIADNGPTTYRARAIQTLGANWLDKGQPNETLRFQIEALRAASDRNAQGLQTTLLARWEISIIKSLDGDHEGALSDLNRLSPLVNLAAKQKPFYFYAYCNALAVGLGELGRIGEAEATLELALASPYASAYPEWSETRQELEAKRTAVTPSVVAINRTPEAPPSPQAEPQPKPRRSTAHLSKWLASENTFLQRPSISTAAITIIASDQITQSTLDRVLVCHRSRAPPTAHR